MAIRKITTLVIALGLFVPFIGGRAVGAGNVLSPSSPSFSYDAGPFTNLNVAGLLVGSCDVPQGCDNHDFSVNIPRGYYERIRRQGKVAVVRIALSWQDNANDFDLALLDSQGNPIATSGFGNSDFERINYTELPTGNYTVQVTVFRAINVGYHVVVSLETMTPSPSATAPGNSGVAFSNGTPVTLERNSGEPDMDIAPNGDMYVDFPLGAGTNSILYKSTDNGDTFRPLAPLHPNNNPLANNIAGGGDAGVAIGRDGRLCFTELNTLVSLGIGCSTDGGQTFMVADPVVADPTTPLVDRQWQAITPQGEVFITAEYGIIDAQVSHPGIRLFKEVAPGTDAFTQIQAIDTGKAMKSYNMAVDPSDTDADGGTIVEAYLRSNQGTDKAQSPHELMVWQSTDGGKTITTHKVADLPTAPGDNFASVDVDRQGNTYVAWIEQGTWDVYYSVARKGDLDHCSKPVRVNADPAAATAIQPTIKVGDRGRVFIGYYASATIGNPDNLPGAWNAFLAVSTNGACMLDPHPCAAPTFHQTQVTDHPVQYRGICLGGTGCGGDPYYGDRSMLEFLDIAFTPSTGQAHMVVTDSSRSDEHTTITMYKQISGPSAYAGKPAIRDASRSGTFVADPKGDAGWPYESPIPGVAAPGADITGIQLQRLGKTVRIVMSIADVNAFDNAVLAGAGQEMLIGVRFATPLDVVWVGMRYPMGGPPAFVAGHLGTGGLLVDTYTPDATIPVAGSIDQHAGTITLDVPVSAIKTTLEEPSGVKRPEVAALGTTTPLYSAVGFSFVGIQSIDDGYPKHLLDVTPSFDVARAIVRARRVTSGSRTSPGGSLPATGVTDESLFALALLAFASAIVLRRRLHRL